MRFRKLVWPLAVVAGVYLLTLIVKTAVLWDNSQTTGPPSQPGAASARPLGLPPAEVALLDAQARAAERERDAPNDILRRKGRESWEREVCEAVASPNFNSWRATIKSIGGDGSFLLDLGGVDLEGWAREGSPAYSTLSQGTPGDAVAASGRFSPGDDGCTVKLEGLPWGSERVLDPALDVELDAVSPI